MERAYRYLVTVYLEGDRDMLTTPDEIAEHIATAGHDLRTYVRFIESEDYRTAAHAGRTRNHQSLVRQTICRHCELDIEGFAPFKRGEWRDRGNNTHCPTRSGRGGPRLHAPVPEVR